MKDSAVHITLIADGKYLPGLRLTKASMAAACSDPTRLVFHEFNPDEHNLSELSGLPPFKGGHAAYFRLLLPKLLPEVDRVIYADVDTVWFRDPLKLWDEVDGLMERGVDRSIYWVKDIPSTRYENLDYNPSLYGCTGVMVMNLKRMRERDVLGACLEFAKGKTFLKYADQDLLNGCVQDDSQFLSPEWDVVMTGTRSGAVYHIIGIGRHFGFAETEVSVDSRLPQHALWFAWYDMLVRKTSPVARHARRLEWKWRMAALMPDWILGILPERKEIVTRIRRYCFFAKLWKERR